MNSSIVNGVGVVAAHLVQTAQRARRNDEMIFGKADDHHPVKKTLHHCAQRRQIDTAVRVERPRVDVTPRDNILRQPLAPFVDERQVVRIDFFGVALVAQYVETALNDVLVGKLPEQFEVMQIRAGVLERQYQPVAPGIEQAKMLEIRQDRPRPAIGKGIVDRLLFFRVRSTAIPGRASCPGVIVPATVLRACSNSLITPKRFASTKIVPPLSGISVKSGRPAWCR